MLGLADLTNGDEHVYPDFPVAKGVLHVLEIKDIGESRSIVFQA